MRTGRMKGKTNADLYAYITYAKNQITGATREIGREKLIKNTRNLDMKIAYTLYQASQSKWEKVTASYSLCFISHKKPQLHYQGWFHYDLLMTSHSSHNKKIICELLKQLSATGSYFLKWVIWHAGLYVRSRSHRESWISQL